MPAWGRFRRGEWSLGMVTGISAITLATHDMARAVAFYRMLGLAVIHGGEGASFTSFRLGANFRNLILQPVAREWSWWGGLSFNVTNFADALTALAASGVRPKRRPAHC